MSKFKITSVLILFLFIIFNFTITYRIKSQPHSTPKELVFNVYADGYVAIDYSIDIDPTRVRVNVSLYGLIYEDLLIEDQDGLPLDYSIINEGLSIDTLGAIYILVSYVTLDLTNKAGQIWSFTVTTPISSTIILPEGSTIATLNQVPLSMSSINGNLLITMPAGEIEVTYTIGVTGTREHALAVIKDAETIIENIHKENIITIEADDLLQQAYNAFNEEKYAVAEQYAEQAKTLAQDVKNIALSASEEIQTTKNSISIASEAGRTIGLDIAQESLQQAEDAYSSGNYLEAKTLAEEAQFAAADATKPTNIYIWILFSMGSITIAITAFVFIRRKLTKPIEPKISYEVDKIFELHPYMRLDDKEVIRFLVDSGGEAFAAEIRQRFDIPRTSLWRMIRRLQNEDIIEVDNVGGQSLIKINSRYLSSAKN